MNGVKPIAVVNLTRSVLDLQHVAPPADGVDPNRDRGQPASEPAHGAIETVTGYRLSRPGRVDERGARDDHSALFVEAPDQSQLGLGQLGREI